MEQSFKIVQQLVANFKINETAYLASNYSESQVRSDFIDKFFTALGWDVTHTKQFNPYEQEVKIENKVTMPGTQRRADYAFFIMPNYRDVKFFTEAKKPSRNLSNANDYYQAIRYAWNANTPIAVLTDFEEFHILDCRYKPDIKDSLNRKIKQYHYSHYADEEKFKEIFYLFGREAVANGSLEKFAAALPKPKGKTLSRFGTLTKLKAVDEDFLEVLDEYRNTLAKAFKKENQELGGEELTEAVQRTIDRLVFIRFLEDKGIEEPQIIGLHENKSAWNSFLAICKRFEPKYNGLIFKPHRILDGNKFNPPDDRDFADICGELSDPTSPYDFDKIPISILGSIYERFLGKVVHATAKRVEVQEKPEVRKAGGVYYTPEYIVRYIVKETVGKLIENKTPDEIAKMSFADIACGSGSFLIEVYSVLLEYHDRWYNANRSKAKKEDVFERDGHLHLSLKKKKEILTNNVYGVDIDFQATEVTQLSLYLKLLENVSMNETHQMGLFKETILPNLNNNIVCGNSLIGTDIGGLFENEETDKLKAMNYEDVFQQIMKRGGFDAVVGNPPYGFHQIHTKEMKAYFKEHFASSQGSYEHYFLFYDKSLMLLKKNGLHGFIVPVTWLTIPSAKSLRKLILDNFYMLEICWLPELVFKNAQVNTLISIIKKTSADKVKVNIYDRLGFTQPPIKELQFDQIKFIKDDYYIGIFQSGVDDLILKKIFDISQSLSEIAQPRSGYNPYEVGNGLAPNGKPQTIETVKTKPYHSDKKLGSEWKQEIIGRYLSRYYIELSVKRYVKYGPWLSAPRDPNNFLGKRILVQEITGGKEKRIIAAYYEGELYHSRDIIPIKIILEQPGSLYILGLINSKLMSWVHHKKNPKAQKGLFPKVLVSDLAKLPIRKINYSNPEEKSKHDNIVKLVDQMLEAKQKLTAAKTDGEVNRLELLCASLDRKIDEAVYESNGLTEEEIKIVENV